MTITIGLPRPIAPQTQTWIGQGFALSGTISGPTALDDTIEAELTDNIRGNVITKSLPYVLGGGTSWVVRLTQLPVGCMGSPINAAVTIQLVARHASGTVFDTLSDFSTYLHDPNAGVAGLLGTAGHDAMLDTILAAVTQTYT